MSFQIRTPSNISANKLETAPKKDSGLDVQQIFELAESAHSLYLTRIPHDQGELLRKFL